MAKSSKRAKSVMPKAQRSVIQRFAGLKAHAHPTFQKQRTPAERKAIIASYNAALKTAPKFIRTRFERL